MTVLDRVLVLMFERVVVLQRRRSVLIVLGMPPSWKAEVVLHVLHYL